MIGKVSLGNYAKGILEYCYYEKVLTKEDLGKAEVRGEIIYLQNLALKSLSNGQMDINYLAKQFVENSNRNPNLSKPIWHQSFSFEKDEVITNVHIQQITEDFCEEFGFKNNQVLSVKHTDTEHPHFHIVANRVDSRGKNTADHFHNYMRTGQFCRKMEEKYGFKIAPQMHILEKDKSNLASQSKIADAMRSKIDARIVKVSTLDELKIALKKDGIKTDIGRGIAFTLKDKGVTFKGSKLGREYSKQKIEERIQEQVQIRIMQSEQIFKKSEDELKEENHDIHFKEKEQFEKANNLKIRVPQSGHANVKDAELAKDIRSLDEKKKDFQRRKGGMSL